MADTITKVRGNAVEGADTYELYEKLSDGTYELKDTSGSLNFIVSNLAFKNGNHILVVKAKGAGYKDSEYSNEVTYVADNAANTFTWQYSELQDYATITLEVTDDVGTTTIGPFSGSKEPQTVEFVGNTCTVKIKYNVTTSGLKFYVLVNDNKVHTASSTSSSFDVTLSPGDVLVIDNDSTCFPAGTPVLMADGTQKLIEDIEVGDKVQSFNIETNEYCEGEVTEIVVGHTTRMAMLLFSDNSYLAMAEGHPLYTPTGWHSITNKDGYPTLVVGDKVLGAFGYVEIMQLDVVDTGDAVPVYSLSINGGGAESTLQEQQQFQPTANYIYFAGTVAAIAHI